MDSMLKIQEILKNTGLGTTFNAMTPEERERFRCDSYNKEEGKLHEADGYDCKVCRNKGDIWVACQDDRGQWTHFSRTCKCEEVRRSIQRMKRSGLKNIIKDYTFDKFEAEEDWQKAIKEAAQTYAKEPKGWFFLGGQSGAGKTHLCTAICREFLHAGKSVIYMLWRDEIVRIKGAATESSEVSKMLDRYKKAEVLYIDDLFKTGKAADNTIQKPTVADINYAFEIINYRYNNPNLLTIISSELTEDELLDIDEAIGGRIFERAKSISIAKNRARNYRIRKAVTL